jgi:SAM-dependent methyltransferase
MAFEVMVDPAALREQVKEKYRQVADNPRGSFHFRTGRPAAAWLGYDERLTASFPDTAVESFAGVANPFSLRALSAGERVVDLGSGGGFDCFVAAAQVGPNGYVVGVDMTQEMLIKSRAVAAEGGRQCAGPISSGLGSSFRPCFSQVLRPQVLQVQR